MSTSLMTLGAGKPDDKTLLAAKWEGLAIAPARDNAFPDDWFLFAAVSPKAGL